MPAPKKIPANLEPDLLRMLGEGKNAREMVEWLKAVHGISVTVRAVRKVLDRIRKERAEVVREVVRKKLEKTVATDIDAVDKLLRDAARHQVGAEKLQKLLDEAEKIAFADIAKTVGPSGAFLPLDKMPDDIRGAVAGIETFEEFEGEGADRVKVGETVKLKLWEKTKAIELAAKIRSGHMAMQAMAMQKSLLELRFKLSGAGGSVEDDSSAVRDRLLAKIDGLAKKAN